MTTPSTVSEVRKDVKDFVQLGRKLDAKKRKGVITYSKKNRDRLVSKESKLLKKIAALILTIGAMAAAYALFHNRNDLRTGLEDITKAIGPKLDNVKKRLWNVWNRTTTNEVRTSMSTNEARTPPFLPPAPMRTSKNIPKSTPQRSVSFPNKSTQQLVAYMPKAPEFSFFRYLGKSIASSAKTRFHYTKNSYIRGVNKIYKTARTFI